MVEWIIKAGAVAAAITAIIVLAVKVRNAVRFFAEMKKSLDTLVQHDKEQHLEILRLTIMNSEMPIAERIIAGQKYIEKGGNGDVKKYYEEYLRHLKEE